MMDEWMVAKATSNSYVKQQQGGKFHPGGVPTGNWVHRGGGYIRKKRLSCARLTTKTTNKKGFVWTQY